jgi:alpha-1,3-glucosyltransferase
MAVTLDDVLVLTGVFLLKSMLSSHPHSGQGTPPIYGDYEAQRHWQEITLNLPVDEWYRNSSRNELIYWGLDYPPLTAYHSLAMAHVAKKVDPSFVALETSRGMEDERHRTFMRATVLAADLAVWIPASLFFAKTLHPDNAKNAALTLSLITLYPGLLLIDNGHFQYNNISLGFFVFAVAFLARRRVVFGSVFFCLALNYKQMELYHALPFFFYLLGLCWKDRSVGRLIAIGSAVIITMGLVWIPFLTSIDSAAQVTCLF